ncbi:MAG TPA: SAM-dependent methyltransferase [Myxococcaceae bacterium]|nr:SAM-dependent methyltransferase [Myxococcaceae bacterium]
MSADRERALELFGALFAGADGYRLSHGERKRLGNEDRALVYGEIDPRGFGELLDRVGVAPGECFWDVGAGTGKPVLLAAMLFPFARCRGVEVLAPLHAEAELRLERYRREVLPQLPEEKRRQEIQLLSGRYEAVDLGDADVLFSHCTTFDDEGLATLAAACARLKPGSRIITVGQPLLHSALETAFDAPVPMEWGESICHVYRVLPAAAP